MIGSGIKGLHRQSAPEHTGQRGMAETEAKPTITSTIRIKNVPPMTRFHLHTSFTICVCHQSKQRQETSFFRFRLVPTSLWGYLRLGEFEMYKKIEAALSFRDHQSIHSFELVHSLNKIHKHLQNGQHTLQSHPRIRGSGHGHPIPKPSTNATRTPRYPHSLRLPY